MAINKESVALNVLNESLKLPFIKVDRSDFLTKTFSNKIDDMPKLFKEGPQAFFSKEELDRIASNVINSNVLKSSSISFASGLPGGVAIAATIPADMAQFYGYSLKLAQEISYVYGYQDIWTNQDELTEDAKNTLILYLGIMFGVSSAGSTIRILSNKLALQALKQLPNKTLTKHLYFTILKKVLAIFGTKLTKATFAKGVSKVIPVVGGVLSGSMNYLSLKPMANKLKDELGKSVNYTQQDFEQDIKILNEEDVLVTEYEPNGTTTYDPSDINQIDKI
ncbi:EcsC family protein [Lactiplantibacillus pentosus]|uniref:Bacteriochlorophyll 4-vinyl reductase n=1 Tax=Lactiplantibacillus paraplantarum TaxID=60520 RepID=A0ABQ0NF74_9LACO|nr:MULTISPECIES: EcsC family protein [Lactiplantibacillus]MCB7466705.1 EcsC family protein [Lactiplantibacillus plantarum]MCB7470254.1 EcsC family protein [Lactiplantibacillus plantarum]MCB7473443.1 EcsC family protein [Lactiplantibacillus plantarum]MCB7476440.1 EcsC family protein [Lactiplantibacillus plantarum]MCB7479171.1 EcsC family protein [Lactiplantibacillus plantarum]